MLRMDSSALQPNPAASRLRHAWRGVAVKLTCLLLAAAVALGPGLGAPLRAQPGPAKPAEQDPAVQLKAELIEVRAVVTDKRGQIIDGLKKEDFELLENNRPQELSFFAVERVGGAAGAAAPGKEVSPTPGLVRPADPPGRTVVLFVDTLHLSPSSLLRMKQTLKEFVGKQLSDGDLVALVTSGGRLGLLSQFTRDRQILRYAIDRLSPDTGSKDSFFSPYLAASVERGMPDALTVAIQILRIEENLSGPRDFLERMAQARARQVRLRGCA